MANPRDRRQGEAPVNDVLPLDEVADGKLVEEIDGVEDDEVDDQPSDEKKSSAEKKGFQPGE
ncbi:MAG: hypothetical protein V3R83_10215, partial [Gammaproteobacteria bacterium]